MSDYDAEQWVGLYRSALLELGHSLMAGRLVDARGAIVKRIEKLRDTPGLHIEERRAIDEALRNLTVVEQDEARFAAEQHPVAARKALEQLEKLKPAIQRLASGPSDAGL